MFIFLLTPFDARNCYCFESNLSLMLLIKVLLSKKCVTLLCSLLNMKKQFFLMSFFFFWKKGSVGGGGGWGAIEGWFKTSAHYDVIGLLNCGNI